MCRVAIKTQRRTVGAVLRISLGDGTCCYAQTLRDADFAFFDLHHKLIPRLISSLPSLFVFVWQ